MKVVWYVICYNEKPILPFIIDYWQQIADKVIVYDNESTDGTLDLLKQYDWIEVRSWSSNNQIDENNYLKIKNNCWKEQKGKGVDWVVVSDVDEILWASDIQKTLEQLKDSDVSITIPAGLDFVSEKFPEYKKGQLLHEQIKTYAYDIRWNKSVLFNPDKVTEINYNPGCHTTARPIYCGRMLNIRGLYLFHFKYLSYEYLKQKWNISKNRLSDVNLKNRWGIEYTLPDKDILYRFNMKWKSAQTHNILDLLKKRSANF